MGHSTSEAGSESTRSGRRRGRKGGVEKPGGFFNVYGAPVPGARVEKLPGFFNKDTRENECIVEVGLGMFSFSHFSRPQECTGPTTLRRECQGSAAGRRWRWRWCRTIFAGFPLRGQPRRT